MILVVSIEVIGRWLIWVQKAADGSVYKLSHYCTQSELSHKPWKVREVSVIMSSSLQHIAKQELILS